MIRTVQIQIIGLGLIWLLSACKPAQVSHTPTPSLYALRVGYSPDTRPALPALKQCAAAQQNLALLADEIPVTIMESSGKELWLRLGMPENRGGYAVQLADEQISIVINPGNSTRSLNFGEIQSIFSGELKSWSQVGGPDQPINVWVLPPDDEARDIADQSLLADQSISDQSFLAASPLRMLEAIANDPDAIGYLPQAWIDSTVKSVPLPINQQAALAKPLLALTSSEPEGQLREFLACMQSGPGQKTLKTLYKP